MSIIKFIKEIDSNNSQKFKFDKLLTGFKNIEIYNWIKIIYDINRNFYFTDKSLPFKSSTKYTRYNEQELLTILIDMSERKLTKVDILNIYNSLSDEMAFLFKRSINKNLFVNVSLKLLNKAHTDIYSVPLYEEFPYMRCSLIDSIENITYPAIAQLKSDGTFVNLKISFSPNNIDINIYFRNGRKMELSENGCFLTHLRKLLSNKSELITNFLRKTSASFIIMGELLIKDETNEILSRQEGNGLINSLSKQFSIIQTLRDKAEKSKKISLEIDKKINMFDDIEQRLYIRVWDILDEYEWLGYITNSTKYKERFDYILKLFKDNSDIIAPTEYKEVNSLEEANLYFKELLSKGEEGIILKNYNSFFKNGISKDIIKFKEIKECDLLVIGFNIGNGQFEGGIGSLICVSADKKLKVNVFGLSREMRGLEPIDINDMSKGLKIIDNFDMTQYNNKIVTVEFNRIINNKNNDTYSLFLPRIISIREDKKEADTLDYILKL